MKGALGRRNFVVVNQSPCKAQSTLNAAIDCTVCLFPSDYTGYAPSFTLELSSLLCACGKHVASKTLMFITALYLLFRDVLLNADRENKVQCSLPDLKKTVLSGKN